jgi:hypothetical protein
MSISDIAFTYIWFVLGVYCVLIVRRMFHPETQKNFGKLKRRSDGVDGSANYNSPQKIAFGPVEDILARLLSTARNGTVLIVRHADSERFLQVRKYFQDIHHFGIEFCFPNAAWAHDRFVKLRTYCENNNIAFRIGTDPSSNASEYLYVDCGQDLSMAQALARLMWTDFFKLSLEAERQAPYYRFNLLDNVTDAPDQGAPSFEMGWLRKNGVEPPSRAAHTLCALWILIWLVILFGLPISLLSSAGEVPDWSFTLGQLNLSGTSGSLIFFCLFVVNLFRHFYFRTKFRVPNTWIDANILPVWYWIVVVTLPMSAIAIWTGS